MDFLDKTINNGSNNTNNKINNNKKEATTKTPNSKHLMTGTAIFIAAILVISGTNIKAFADNVTNNVDTTAEQGKITAGGSTTVGYKIVGTGGDGQTGCNPADGSKAIVTINVPNGVSVTPGSLTFATCNDFQNVVFQSSTVGDHTITVGVSDSGTGTYSTNTATFTLHVIAATPTDTAPPVVTVPADTTVEATGPSGAVVTFTGVSALDETDGPLTPTCSPASGSTFPIGTTTVKCDATDAAGNTGSKSFTVTVADTTEPIVTVPANMEVEATGPTGATVTYSGISATDLVDGTIPNTSIICTPASGSNFALDQATPVTCSATDLSGNTGKASFTVSVVDKTGPSVTAPASIAVDTTGPSGATVQYTVADLGITATDLVDGTIPSTSITCTPTSGSTTFPIGTNTGAIKCIATDAHGNTGEGLIDVIVRAPLWASGFLQPINNDGSSVFKYGSIIPVKFQLRSAISGAYYGACECHVKVFGPSGPENSQINEVAATSVSSADSGDIARYDPSANQYVFNLSTKSWKAGSEYIIRVYSDGDSTAHEVKVGSKK